MRGRLDVREIEDLPSDVLSAAEAKALASGNPLLLERSVAQRSGAPRTARTSMAPQPDHRARHREGPGAAHRSAASQHLRLPTGPRTCARPLGRPIPHDHHPTRVHDPHRGRRVAGSMGAQHRDPVRPAARGTCAWAGRRNLRVHGDRPHPIRPGETLSSCFSSRASPRRKSEFRPSTSSTGTASASFVRSRTASLHCRTESAKRSSSSGASAQPGRRPPLLSTPFKHSEQLGAARGALAAVDAQLAIPGFPNPPAPHRPKPAGYPETGPHRPNRATPAQAGTDNCTEETQWN
jgi:hypothetical protein